MKGPSTPSQTPIIRRLLIALIHGYRLTISPFVGNCCRFYPSCSAYAIQALTKHSLFKALGYILKRLLRCSPLSRGGVDLVP